MTDGRKKLLAGAAIRDALCSRPLTLGELEQATMTRCEEKITTIHVCAALRILCDEGEVIAGSDKKFRMSDVTYKKS